MDTARAPSSLRGLVQLQPMGPSPIPGTSGSPSPSHRLQRQGGFGGRKRRETAWQGERAEQPRGAGAEKGAGSAEAGWRAGAGGGVSAAAAGVTSSAALRGAATDLGPRAGAPSVPPALRGSARPPASIGPPGLEAGAGAARVLLGGKSGGGPQKSRPANRQASCRAELRASEAASEAASEPGGGEEGARRERTSEPSEPRERVRDGRQ